MTATKHIGINTLVALGTAGVTAAIAFGYFQGRVEVDLAATAKSVAANAQVINGNENVHRETHTSMWRSMAESKEAVTRQYTEVQRELGSLTAELKVISRKLDKE